MSFADHLIYALLWLSFGAAHSVLAAPGIVGRFGPGGGRYYRFFYNGVSALHVLVVLAVGEHLLGSDAPKIVPPLWDMVRWVAFGLGLVILLVAFRKYDTGRFLGLTQLRQPGTSDDDEALVTDGLQRYMRHPLYTGAILALWGRAATEPEFATAAWATLYFIIGAYFEERKLVTRFGDAYRTYQRTVPAFIPWKLSARQK